MDVGPDSSAVRTALWRALHVEVDAPPHLLDDEIGVALVAPDEGWRDRPDMHPIGTGPYRGAIVARTRFVEDLLVEEGIGQYLLLGAGLDTFAQRHPDRATVFEIDQPGPQAWKRRRLEDLDYGVPAHLRLVPVDFEAGEDWWAALVGAGFDLSARALVSSSGVSMYISKEATIETLDRLAGMAPRSIVAMTFMLPIGLADESDRPGLERARDGAEASGTPWISFFTPEEIVTIAGDAGFVQVDYVSTQELASRYLADRTDELRAASGEGILLART
jgi:methyltransferase (TIGR00027 family)